MKKKVIAILLACTMLIGALAGCGSSNSAASNSSAPQASKTAADGGTLVLGSLTDFKEGSGLEGQSLIFDLLVNKAEDMSITPGIIESWETDEKQTTYTLHIRKGVQFSDGTPLTADIVKYSIEAWAPFRDGSYMYSDPVYTVVDDNTLEMRFKESYGNLMIQLSRIYCTLPDSLDDLGNITNYIGTGPFVLDNYEKDQSATLTKNPNYWNKDKIPSIDTVEWKVIPDENSRVLALQSGDVDAIGVTEHYCSLPYSSISSIEEEGKFNVDVHRGAGLVATYVYNYLKGPMTDIHLRKAVTSAIDREGLTKSMTYGYGDASGYFMLQDYRYSARNESAYTYDTKRAKDELAQAGYKDTDGDGIVEKDGKPLQLILLVGSTETERSTAVYVQDNLKAVGIGVDIQALDDSARGAAAEKGDFDIAYTHPWLKTPQTYMSWRCSASGYDDFGTTFVINDKFEDYNAKMNAATSEDELWKLFDQIWADEYAFYPATPLYSTPRVFIYSKHVTGFQYDPEETVIDLSKVTIQK